MRLLRQRESLGAQQDYESAMTLLADVHRTGPVLRLYQPVPTVAFGRRDELRPGFAAAARAARESGFEPLVRRVGGRAAAYHGGCLVVDHLEPAEDPTSGIQDRYRLFGDMVVAALEELEVEADVGEIPGEYCAGEHSVHGTHPSGTPAAGRRVKLAGTAQRVVAGAWYFSTVVVVEQSEPIRSVLTDVYAALDLDWDPATAGAVDDLRPGTTVADVERGIRKVYGMYANHLGYGPLTEPD
ncbi:lipoate--protein ligase family protein [Kocuria flava]|nr:lipoate--protein ligase family protein [Kocuria flava]